MRFLLKILGGFLLLLVPIVGGFLAKVAIQGIPSYPVQKADLRVEVTPDRVARGKVIAKMLCRPCHLDSKTGRLTGQHMPDLPTQFGNAYSKNINQDKDAGIDAWTDGEIAFLRSDDSLVIADPGPAEMSEPSFRPLTKMPPFQGILKGEEYAPLVAYVRKLGERAGR